MSRKNKKSRQYEHKKATHIQDEDGWTHVVRGPTAVRLNASGSTFDDAAGSASSKTIPNSSSPNKTNNHNPQHSKVRPSKGVPVPGYILAPPPLTSLAELRAEHEKQRQLLEKSDVVAGLRRALVRGLEENLQIKGIRNAVCIGLGSLSTFRRTTSMRQLVAFEMMVEVLAEHERLSRKEIKGKIKEEGVDAADSTTAPKDNGTGSVSAASSKAASIPVYFQELAFTELDRAFLSSRGYHTITPKDGSQVDEDGEDVPFQYPFLGPISKYINSSTLFYAPHLETDVIRLAIETTIPILYFGTNMKERESWCSPIKPRSNRSKDNSSDKTMTGNINQSRAASTKNGSQNIGNDSGKANGSNDVDTESKLESEPPQGEAPESQSEKTTQQSHRQWDRWITGSKWYAPPETRRAGHEDNNWASDFAFALASREG